MSSARRWNSFSRPFKDRTTEEHRGAQRNSNCAHHVLVPSPGGGGLGRGSAAGFAGPAPTKGKSPLSPLREGSSGNCGESVGWGEQLFCEPQRLCRPRSWGSCLTPTYRFSSPKLSEEPSQRGGRSRHRSRQGLEPPTGALATRQCPHLVLFHPPLQRMTPTPATSAAKTATPSPP
jgi:hypothetical protein